jgi:hypothetical protein
MSITSENTLIDLSQAAILPFEDQSFAHHHVEIANSD